MRTRVVALILSAAALGCEAPSSAPFHELSLRDALQADPRAILAMSGDARAALAERFEAARTVQREDRALPDEGLLGAIFALDTLRADAAEDALVVGRFERVPGGSRVHHLELEPADGGVESPCDVPLELDEELRGFEAALSGPPGQVLCRCATRYGVARARAVRGVPAGVVVDEVGGVLEVNPAWLAAFMPPGEELEALADVASASWALGDDAGVRGPTPTDHHPSGTSGCGCSDYTACEGCRHPFTGETCIPDCTCTVCYAGDDHVCICRTAPRGRGSQPGSGLLALAGLVVPVVFLLLARRRP